jgi:hypothetical protein
MIRLNRYNKKLLKQQDEFINAKVNEQVKGLNFLFLFILAVFTFTYIIVNLKLSYKLDECRKKIKI